MENDIAKSEEWQELYKQLSPNQQQLYMQALNCEDKAAFEAFKIHKQLAAEDCVLSIHWLGNCYLNLKFSVLWQYDFPSLASIVHELETNYCIHDDIYANEILSKILTANFHTAKQLLSIAASYNYSPAQYDLGMFYFNSLYKEQNTAKAKELFELAAQKNHIGAKYKLAVIYEQEGDITSAIPLYKCAAENNCASAALKLGLKYALGKDIPKDPNLSSEWITKAANWGDPFSQLLYSNELLQQDNLSDSFEYCLKSAQGEYACAQYSVADKYLTGASGAPEDFKLALKWYTKAAINGNPNSLYCLGVMYENGIGTKQDLEKAICLYFKAAGAGISAAKQKLGLPDPIHPGSTIDTEQPRPLSGYIQDQIDFISNCDPNKVEKNSLAELILKL
jgi:TPR repeat protein